MAGAGQGTDEIAGANYWRSGADTCVLDRAVGCADDNAVKREDLEGYVSRIVPANSDDAKIEKQIGEWYPYLVDMGLLAISKYQCTPKFLNQNLTSKFNKGPCSKVSKDVSANSYANLITKRYDMTFGEYMDKEEHKGFTLSERFYVLRGVMNAVVAMTQDHNKQWVIHTDIHSDNILYDEQKDQTALADFGRVILIEDKDDVEKIYNGLRDFVFMMRKKIPGFGFDNRTTIGVNINMFIQMYEIYNQKLVTKEGKKREQYLTYMNEKMNLEKMMILESFSKWGILQILERNSLRKDLSSEDIKKLNTFTRDIFYTKTIKDLVQTINTFMIEDMRIYEDYIDLDYYEKKMNASTGGARKKRSRKQKKKQRKTRKH